MSLDFKKSTILVTGGTGSFGTTVATKLLNLGVKEIRIFSRDEKKQDEMRKQYTNHNLKFYIGDVRDASSLDHPMRGVDYIFHAAALKQVPSCEFFPIQAVKTNVLGTHNVLNSAIRHNIQRVVVLSTDKAVYPINAMGMSKAMMEKVMVAESRNAESTSCTMVGTRYGNVIASRGSVIPLFIRQILEGNEITITEPTMTRFLMSLDNAVALVLHAFQNGNPGDIFVQKSPAATIDTIAKALMQLLDREVGIRVIGRRHGEKDHETLVSSEELAVAKESDSYYCIPRDSRSSNYTKEFPLSASFDTSLSPYDSSSTTRLDVEQTKQLLLNTKEVARLLLQKE